MRFALRNKNKIVNDFGLDYYNLLINSLTRYFKTRIEIPEYNLSGVKGYKFIFVPNIQPNTDCEFEFAIIEKTYDVYKLAYYSAHG
jgi:hypothetical protein